MADVLTKIMISEVKNSVDSKIKSYTYTATTNSVSNITHNLDYNSSTDKLLVYYGGFLLSKEKNNYTENINNKSISLVDWTINQGDTIDFILYKNVKN